MLSILSKKYDLNNAHFLPSALICLVIQKALKATLIITSTATIKQKSFSIYSAQTQNGEIVACPTEAGQSRQEQEL